MPTGVQTKQQGDLPHVGFHYINCCFRVALMAQLVWRHSCVADRLLVVDRIPAGPWVRLKLSGPCLRAETGRRLKKNIHQLLFHVCKQQESQAQRDNFSRRQVSGMARHLSEKLLWIQEKTADGSFQLRQVPTVCKNCPYRNKDVEQAKVVDLLYECGLVYITDFTRRVFWCRMRSL